MPMPSRPLEERLLEKLDVKGPDDCWLVKNTKQKYGRIKLGGTPRVDIGSHVAAHLVWIGPVPPGMYVCHKCDTPRCCNPKHLFLGTPQDNVDDRDAKGRHWVPRGKSSPHYKHGKYAEYS